MKKFFVFFTLLTICFGLFANEHRPKIALVLSGGGARGAAHIGVIEALEELNIPIDFIVGTSMGAVIGGLYASGVPIQKIDHDFKALNWDKIFSYDIERKHLYYRRKLDSDLFLIQNFVRYSKGKLHLPKGLITGQNLYELFNSYILPIQPIDDFDRLPIPFRAVSTDVVTGKPVVLENGDLALSLLASMAVPGIISPIDLNGYLLVDGGVSCNLPIEIAKKMGADILIVVDVSTPLSKKEELIDLKDILGQITNILTHKNLVVSRSFLNSQDIVLAPDVDDIDTTDFEKFKEAIHPGKIAVLNQKEKLLKLADPAQAQKIQYNNFANLAPIYIERGKLIGDPVICDQTYYSYLDFDSTMSTPKEVKEKVDYLYGINIFERIYYGIEETQVGRTLIIKPKLYEDNPLYVQGSVFFNTDFQTTNTFSLLLGVTNPQINDLLGEWRILAKIGYDESLFAEYYQPLTPNLAWFVNPTISIERTPITLYYNYDDIALYLINSNKVLFSGGRNFSNWGRITAYWLYENDDYKLRIGNSFLPEGHIGTGELGAIFEWDTLDDTYFPKHGVKGNISYAVDSRSYGSDSDFTQLSVNNLAAISSGKHAFSLLGSYNRTCHSIPNFTAKYFLGGLFQLTGLVDHELFGNNAGLLSTIYFYQFKKIKIVPNRPMLIYLGGSLESGKVWGDPNLSDNRFVDSASFFIAADTLMGPIYLAIGATDTGRKAIHLMLRPPFSLGKLR